jgi:hypothetical protein
MGFSRSGIPAQLEPWRSIWSSSGNAFEVNFIPDYKILHHAGYNVTDPSDVQAMFDNIPLADKQLHWILGTAARWDGYLEFQRRPEPALEWFEKHMA